MISICEIFKRGKELHSELQNQNKTSALSDSGRVLLVRFQLHTWLLVFILLFTFAGTGKADVEFYSNSGLFSFAIPPRWIYQINESNDQLLVFHGSRPKQLFYIELLGEVRDCDSYDFGKRVLEHYSADYGLRNFQIESGLSHLDLADVASTVVEYSFTGSEHRIERRIFVVVDGMGITITYSDAKTEFLNNASQFEAIIASWKWEVDL